MDNIVYDIFVGENYLNYFGTVKGDGYPNFEEVRLHAMRLYPRLYDIPFIMVEQDTDFWKELTEPYKTYFS